MNIQDRIVDVLRERIRAGEHPPGERIPTVRALQAEFATSLLTVHRALRRLADLGFIATRGRNGTVVVAHPPHLHRFGLVIPEAPQADGTYANLHWQALALAAATFVDPQRRIELFHCLGPQPELPEHVRLRQALADRRLAGLIVPVPAPPRLGLARCGLPVIGGGLPAGRRRHGDIFLNQTDFLDRAFDLIVARGLHRVAVLCLPEAWDYARDHIAGAATANGLDCPARRVLAVSAAFPGWAGHAVEALFHGDDPPEALVIADDHLVPAATAAAARRRHPPFVVAEANFPVAAASALPCVRLGWDQRAYLDLAIDRLAAHLATGAAVGIHRLPPIEDPPCRA